MSRRRAGTPAAESDDGRLNEEETATLDEAEVAIDAGQVRPPSDARADLWLSDRFEVSSPGRPRAISDSWAAGTASARGSDRAPGT